MGTGLMRKHGCHEWTCSGLRLGGWIMAASHPVEKPGCGHRHQSGPSELNYNHCCWDTGGQQPEVTSGTLDNCPIYI